MRKFLGAGFLVLISVVVPAAAQDKLAAIVAAQCGGAGGKAFACCKQVVTANPKISQCGKEVAVFRCIGNKNNAYVSPNGCVMPKL